MTEGVERCHGLISIPKWRLLGLLFKEVLLAAVTLDAGADEAPSVKASGGATIWRSSMTSKPILQTLLITL